MNEMKTFLSVYVTDGRHKIDIATSDLRRVNLLISFVQILFREIVDAIEKYIQCILKMLVENNQMRPNISVFISIVIIIDL